MNSLSSGASEKFKQFLAIALTLATTVVLSGLAALVPVISANAAGLLEGSLIKSADAPAVYIINDKAHGTYAGWKRHIFNPDVFNMYGHLSWANIQTVSQATLDSYHTSDLYSADGDPKVYSLEEMGTSAVKHHVENEAAFLANGFSWDQIFHVNERERDYYATGSIITATVVPPVVTPPVVTPPVVGSGLSVSLASDTASANTILSDDTANQYPQALIPFTKVNFAAGSDGDVKVTSLNFTRTGIASDSDLGNLYLYDGDVRLAEYTSFNSKVLTFTNSAGLFTVAKGTTKSVTLKGDLARTSPSVSASKNIGFDLVSASNVTTDGASVSGSFPVSGNKMTTAQVTDLGTVHVAGSYATNPATTVKGDAVNQELWNFSLVSSNQDMEVRNLKLTMIGTIASTNIKNLKLEVGGVQVGSAMALEADNSVTFNLASSPIMITSGQTKVLSLKGDLTGGASRTFYFSIQRSSDLSVYDAGYGVYVTPAKDAATTAFGIIKPTSSSTVDSGSMVVGVTTDSPTGNIADAATGLTLAKFSFYSAGETAKISDLTVGCTSASNVLTNVKLLLDGSQIGTTDSSVTCGTAESFTFGNTFQVPASATKYLTVVADTTDSTVLVGETVVITLAVGSSNIQFQTTLTSANTTAQTARTLTVQSGTASVVKNVALGDKSSTNPTGTVNATDVKIGSFLITAGSGEAINVTQIALADVTSGTVMGTDFQNLKIKNSTGTQIGSTVTSLNTTAGTYTFTPSPAINIAAGQQYVVDVYADLKSSATEVDHNPVMAFDSVTATGVSTSSDASYTTNVDLQTAYVSANGNLTITKGADTPIAQQIVMGSTEVSLATFKLAADAAEAILVSDITVSDTVSSAATGTLKNIKLFVDGLQIGQTIQLDTTSATSTYAHAVFSGLSLTVPKNGSKLVTVKGDVTTSDDGAVTGSTHSFAMLANKGSAVESVTAKGSSSGVSITGAYLDYSSSPDVDQVGNAMTAYATKLTVAYATDSPSGVVLATTADQVIAKINVTNSSNIGSYTATIKSMNFAISSLGTSKPAATARNLKVYKDSVTTSNLVATTSWAAGENLNYGDTKLTNGTSSATNFIDTSIAAGTTKTFLVTLDTNDADTANDSITIGMASDDLAWRDSKVTSDISASDSLPLLTKNLTR
ncbi:MAG: hypothetical protein AAB614_01135 [Patescibacteria group bacterium]